jgi:hypothetical protein
MLKPRWIPVPYYNNSPLSKVPAITSKLPHKLGFIPKYIKGDKGDKGEKLRSKA